MERERVGSSDSDDSGFGDSLPDNASVQQRIAKMRSLMNLTSGEEAAVMDADTSATGDANADANANANGSANADANANGSALMANGSGAEEEMPSKTEEHQQQHRQEEEEEEDSQSVEDFEVEEYDDEEDEGEMDLDSEMENDVELDLEMDLGDDLLMLDKLHSLSLGASRIKESSSQPTAAVKREEDDDDVMSADGDDDDASEPDDDDSAKPVSAPVSDSMAAASTTTAGDSVADAVTTNAAKQEDTAAPPPAAPAAAAVAAGAAAYNDLDDEEEEEEDDDAYTVTWSHGQLGLLFKQSHRGETIIRRVNKKSGNAQGLQVARAGDVLHAINGASMTKVPFAEIVEQLRAPAFPVTLQFAPPSDSEDEEEEETAGNVVRASDQRHQLQPAGVPSMGASPPPAVDDAYPSTSDFDDLGTTASMEASFESERYNEPASDEQEEEALGPDEFEVVWKQGSLGCGLRQRNGLPLVKSVTQGKSVDVSVQQITPGDVMTFINGMRTEFIGFKGVVETLQRSPKPVYMRFRRGELPASLGGGSAAAPREPRKPTARPVENLRDTRFNESDDVAASAALGSRHYTVLWKTGSLGVQIKGRSSDGAVIVAKFTGSGDPQLVNQISLGDVFTRIAGVEVSKIGIAGAFELLRSVQKPVVLVFERGSPPPPAPTPVVQKIRKVPPPPPAGELRGSTVPSFRVMRQQREEAAARAAAEAAAANGDKPPSSSGSLGDMLVARHLSRSRPGSQDLDATDDASNNLSNSAGSHHGRQPLDDLPRFSDIEAGRIKTAAVTATTALPPPPAYSDLFTQSGRARPASGIPPSPHGGSASSSQGGHASPHVGPPPPYNQVPPPAAGGRVANQLRIQHIQEQRMRHQYPETNQSMLSSYSDLDDSGVMAARKASSAASPPMAPMMVSDRDRSQTRGNRTHAAGPPGRGRGPSTLGGGSGSRQPPPEFWIRWAEGPLGMTFRRTAGQIVVSRLTGAGYSPGLDQLRPGDFLLSFGNAAVGSYSTTDLRLSETMELIRRLPKPVDMCFVVR